MAENPFDSFFTGLIGGATAGARRRTLMERGQQGAGMAEEFFGGGPVTPPKAPGMGATFLAGLQLARTLPTTPSQQLQADQLKLQMANQMLDYKIASDKQAAINAQAYYKKNQEAAEADLEAKNAIIYQQAIDKDRQLARSGNWEAFDATLAPEGMGTTLTDSYYDQKRLIRGEFGRENFDQVQLNKDLLIKSGSYSPESVGQMSVEAIAAASESVSGMYSKLDNMLLSIPFDRRVDLKTTIMTGTPDQKQQAWAELDRSSIELASNIGKIQQDIRLLEAAGSPQNLVDAKQLRGYADSLAKGEEIPTYTITKGEDGTTTFQVGPASKLEDKALDRQILIEFPDLLGQLTQLDVLIDPATSNIKAPLKRFWNTYGTAAAEFLGVPEGTGLNQVFQNVDQIPRLTTAIAQNVRKLIRTDVDMISNYEDRMLEPLTATLKGVRSATQMRAAIVDLRKFLTNSRLLRAHASGKVPNILRNYPRSVEGFEQALTDLGAVSSLNEIPVEEVRSYMNYLEGIYDESIINAAFDGALKPNPAQ